MNQWIAATCQHCLRSAGFTRQGLYRKCNSCGGLCDRPSKNGLRKMWFPRLTERKRLVK